MARVPSSHARGPLTGRARSILREANDRVRSSVRAPAHQLLPFLCECVDGGCVRRVYLTLPEYDLVRRDPLLSFVAPGHMMERAERVVAHTARFEVVRRDTPTRREPGGRPRRAAASLAARR